MQKRTARSPRRAKRDPAYPPGLGYTPRAASPPPRSPSRYALKDKPPSPGGIPCLVYVVAYHALAVGALLVWHYRTHAVINPTQVLLSIFLAINAWICVCEIALLCYPAHIQAESAKFVSAHGAGVLPPVFLFLPVTLRDALSLKYWAVMWSTYASLDPSYVDTTTFGYCVDVCNGVSTLLPTVLFALGMTAQQRLLSARVVGMLGLVSFYQEAYGTVVYFFQFFFNRRQAKVSRALVLGVVVPANAIWIAFPALGMWASSRLIRDGTFDVFL